MIRFKPLKDELDAVGCEAYLLPMGMKKYYSIDDLKELIEHLSDVKHTLEVWEKEDVKES